MALTSGSQHTMLGPTASISALLQGCCLKYGMACLPFISIISGLLVYLIKFYKLEKYIDLFPLSVIEGFTIGTALAMIIGKVNNALGNIKNPHNHNLNRKFNLINNSNFNNSNLVYVYFSIFFK